MFKCKIRNKWGRGKKLKEIWNWRLSNKPEYCNTCRQKLEKKGLIPDCNECEFQIPEPLSNNRLFLTIINDCVYSRDFNGRLNLDVFLKVVNIYGKILNFDAWDELELLRKARFISDIEEKKRNLEKSIGENQSKAKSKTKVLGKR